MSIQAMKQALEALEGIAVIRTEYFELLFNAKKVLRAALAEAERVVTIGHKTYVQQGGYLMGEAEQQGPVAWGRDDGTYITNAEHNELLHHDNWAQGFDTAFYTTPQPAIPDGMVVLFEKAIHHLKQHAAEYEHPGQHKLISDMEAMLAAAPKPGDKE